MFSYERSEKKSKEFDDVVSDYNPSFKLERQVTWQS